MGLYIIWVVLVANLFFRQRAAMLYSAMAIACFSAVLFATDNPYAPNYAVGTTAVMISAGAVVGWLRGRLERVAAQLGREARTDAVTGLPNRRGFNQRCDVEVARTAREGTPLSLVVCDLDRFKLVNDELGHDEGDLALRQAARAIDSSVRAVDAVGRLGGEEFGVVLPGADEEKAMEIAERIRKGVREAFATHPVGLTISCGVATLRNGASTRQALLRSADSALYEAKRRGRDRTVGSVSPRPIADATELQALAASSTK
jgi:diguanylate cyclase (GGDEF)-like protein